MQGLELWMVSIRQTQGSEGFGGETNGSQSRFVGGKPAVGLAGKGNYCTALALTEGVKQQSGKSNSDLFT